MNNTRSKPTTGRQFPSLFDKWHGIFYMPSRIDEAGHTKAFDYPVAEHLGEPRNVQPREDSNRQHIRSQLNALPTELSRLPQICVCVCVCVCVDSLYFDRSAIRLFSIKIALSYKENQCNSKKDRHFRHLLHIHRTHTFT